MQLLPSPAGLDAISAAVHNAFNTPILITSYNHLTYLKKQIAWLTSAGYTNIYIIDNNSSYESRDLSRLGQFGFQSTTGVDISFSPDAFATQELPLDNDSIDEFFISHAFEHVEHTMEMMAELYRAAKPGAKFIIRLPYGKSNKAHQVPIQRHIYFPESFDCFSQPSHSRADSDYRGDWEVKRVSLVVNSNLLQSRGPERVLVGPRRSKISLKKWSSS
jgi:SAM-dependent methyltransferase